jgi:hypothetical protein
VSREIAADLKALSPSDQAVAAAAARALAIPLDTIRAALANAQ